MPADDLSHYPEGSIHSCIELRVVGTVRGLVVAEAATAEHVVTRDPRFALAKFRPTTLPVTLVSRSVLLDRLT